MYKLLFADDEYLVRSKISQMVDWESTGFTLAGCCSNGYELMDLVEKELPDLVILDINMPFITGLEAAAQIRRSYPQIHIVFLTGYTDFEYAKKAVELKALDYIVKPVGAQELLTVLRQARDALDQEKQRVWKLAELEDFYQKRQSLLLSDLFNGTLDAATVSDRLAAYGVQWQEDTPFQVAVFRVDKTGWGEYWRGEDADMLLYALCNVAMELAEQSNTGFVYANKGNVILLGFGGEEKALTFHMQECAESILRTVEKQLQFTASAGLGGVYNGYSQTITSLTEALRALELQSKQGGNRLFTMLDLLECAGSHAAVWDAVNYIEEHYADASLSAEAVCSYLHFSPSYLRSLFKQQTGQTIISYITKVRMERAQALLAEGQLKNSGIAERVGYTDPHYFSYCFKRYFGMTPAEMRTKLRPFQ